MNITTKDSGNVTVVTIKGRIDANTATDLEQRFEELMSKGRTALVVDMKELDFISSAGLRVFLVALKGTKRGGGDLKLAGMKKEVANVFEMTGFTRLFTIERTVKGAVDSYKD